MNETKEVKQKHLFTCDQKLDWWGYGEWVEEFDSVKFEYKDYNCKILRIAVKEPYAKVHHVFGGHLCGYVKIPLELKIHQKRFDVNLDCHGGITFNELDEKGENWIGFDCCHLNDICPSTEYLNNTRPELIEIEKRHQEMMEKLNIKRSRFFDKTYKNINFCIQECKSIVDQIIEGKWKDD